jgi:hypothetical protein
MAMRAAALAGAAIVLTAGVASAQSITAEADLTAGFSTENVRAGSTQVRLFGASASDWRFLTEVSLGGTEGHQSDAFSAAYPYDRRIRAMEGYVEKTFQPGRYIAGFRAGRYRTPFGIYSRGEYGYSGFVRPPLIRYGREFALSNTSLEAGVNLIAGVPQLYGEASFAAPSDEGELHRHRGLDTTLRVQGYYKGIVAGMSRLHSAHNRELDAFAYGDQTFTGFDARWMYAGLQMRGEWIFGASFEGVRTKGGYIDLSVHRRAFGAITPVARIERLDYDAGPFSFYDRRFTAGARVHLLQWLTGQINVIHQPGGLATGRVNVVDAGFTVSVRR